MNKHNYTNLQLDYPGDVAYWHKRQQQALTYARASLATTNVLAREDNNGRTYTQITRIYKQQIAQCRNDIAALQSLSMFS